MQAKRTVSANLGEHFALQPAAGEMVLAVYFDPADRGAALEEFGMVLRTQSDAAGASRDAHDFRSRRV